MLLPEDRDPEAEAEGAADEDCEKKGLAGATGQAVARSRPTGIRIRGKRAGWRLCGGHAAHNEHQAGIAMVGATAPMRVAAGSGGVPIGPRDRSLNLTPSSDR